MRTASLALVALLAFLSEVAADALHDYLAAHPISSIPASAWHPLTTSDSSSKSTTAAPKYDSVQNRCPQSCDSAGDSPANWTAYHDLHFLARCDDPMLLDFSLYTPLDDPSKHISIRSCDAKHDESSISQGGKGRSCSLPHVNRTNIEAPLQLGWAGSRDSTHTADVVAAAQQIERYIAQQSTQCNDEVAFASSHQAVVGVYAGSQIRSQNHVTAVLQKFIAQVQQNGVAENLVAELCATDERNARYSLGIVVNTNADLALVQKTVTKWKDGKCITGLDHVIDWESLTLAVPSARTTAPGNKVGRALDQRSYCSTMKVVSGDTCGSLAAECGISGAQFTDFNPNPKLCSTLAVGQNVCCSAGTLPDFAPKPDANGYCAKYQIASGDTCSAIAAAHSISTDDIEKYNTDTWGWMGCSDLWVKNYICLSHGSPPMPAAIPNAICGPQVYGTATPPPGTNLSTLNPCPLNACCDIWGQCGTTSEFCVAGTSSTGAPGTAPPGNNGCISNCGTEIIIQPHPPSEPKVIAYFEGWDDSRPCLQNSVSNVDTYTHLHYAFATLTPDFKVDISSVAAQFQDFVNLSGINRIISIGGWKFSTSAKSYDIFREAVKEANRATFVKNVVNFLNEYNLDGVDIDWEYPGEPDIPGIPPSSKHDADDLFLFLTELSASMTGKTISVAVPASYWYLKNIPIQEIATVVDYIVYMTYDFHGQWDYGNHWSDSGCPAGNCLRSDVNLTETVNSLSMITKAGVPSNMIAVGITSYGRSFQMTTPGCDGPDCTYTGPQSGAKPGPCTNTAGILANAEIDDIIAANPSGVKQFMDDSLSNILVYDETQWVSYMDAKNKAARKELYKSLHFGGTSDWAVDLLPERGDGTGKTGSGGEAGGEVIYIPPDIWSSGSPQVSCEPPCTMVLPPLPLTSSEVVTWSSYVTSFLSSPTSGGPMETVTSTYSLQPFTLSNIPVWPVKILPGDPTSGTWAPTQSVMPPPTVIELPPGQATIPPTRASFATATSSSSGAPPPLSTSGSSSTDIVFYSTSHHVTLQPQPTLSITYPPSLHIPTVTYQTGHAHPTTTPGCDGCGTLDCLHFGCGGGCGLYGCGGGCGIWGCYGGCGVGGCSGGCTPPFCGNEGGGSSGGGGGHDNNCALGSCPPGTYGGSSSSGGGGEDNHCFFCPPNGGGGGSGGGSGGGPPPTNPNGPKNPKEQCTTLQTAYSCLEIVSSFTPSSDATTYTTSTMTSCRPVEGCSVTATTSTTTLTTSVAYPTSTLYFVDYARPTAPASEMGAVANSIASEQITGGFASPTSTSSTGGGGSGDSPHFLLTCFGLVGPPYPESDMPYAIKEMCYSIMGNAYARNHHDNEFPGLQLFPLTQRTGQKNFSAPEVTLGFRPHDCENNHIPLTQESCEAYYGQITSRCDAGSPWKHGGVLDTGNCMVFNMSVAYYNSS